MEPKAIDFNEFELELEREIVLDLGGTSILFAQVICS